jgi:hypothetical protein
MPAEHCAIVCRLTTAGKAVHDVPMSGLRGGILLAVLAFVVFMANGRVYDGETDSVASRTLPFSILGSGSLYLDPVRDVAIDMYKPDRRWWAQGPTKTGGTASLFPVVTPIIAAPLYVPAVAYLAVRGWTTERLNALSLIMERFAASALSALAVLFMFLALMRRGIATSDALLLATALAFGTGTWSISSQQLWLHAVAELLCALSLWLMAGEPRERRIVAAGACIALIGCNRPADAALVAGLAVMALAWASPRQWWLLGAAGAIPVILTLSYNFVLFGHYLGGWGAAGVAYLRVSTIGEGLAGQLYSPTRGLFVFAPFLLLAPVGIWVSLRQRRELIATVALTCGVVGHLLIYSVTDWRAGWSYGPRYVLDAVPILIWLLAPALAQLHAAGRAAFVVLVAFSIWVQYVGAFHYNSNSDRLVFKDDKDWKPVFENAWKLEHTPFIVEFRNERQPANMPAYLGRL